MVEAAASAAPRPKAYRTGVWTRSERMRRTTAAADTGSSSCTMCRRCMALRVRVRVRACVCGPLSNNKVVQTKEQTSRAVAKAG